MGSCTGIGIFMDFWLTRYDEEDSDGNTITTYKASEIGGDMQFKSSSLEIVIGETIRHEYLNSNFYESFIDTFNKDLQKEIKKR